MSCINPWIVWDSTTGKRKMIPFDKASDIMLQLHNSVFDCGKCLFCRKKSSNELALRCVLHASLYKNNCFLTLTYDEKKEGYNNELQYKHIQDFKKNLRRQVEYHHGKRIEIFNVHEYGKNGKKHWHLIIFNFDFPDKQYFTTKKGNKLFTSPWLETKWKFGFNTIGDVDEGTALYQAQYTQKDITNGNADTEKKAKSNHRGIGLPWFEQNYAQVMQLGYVPNNGFKNPFPRTFERRAHKHFSHFYEPWNFETLICGKKPMYGKFKNQEENVEIANLYPILMQQKEAYKQRKQAEWSNVINEYLSTKKKPAFVQSCENKMHDLKNKSWQKQEIF